MDSASAATAYLERGEPTKGDLALHETSSRRPRPRQHSELPPTLPERNSKGGGQGDEEGGLHLLPEVLTLSGGGWTLPLLACPSQRMFAMEKENRSEVRAVPRGCDQSGFPRKCALHTETWKHPQAWI